MYERWLVSGVCGREKKSIIICILGNDSSFTSSFGACYLTSFVCHLCNHSERTLGNRNFFTKLKKMNLVSIFIFLQEFGSKNGPKLVVFFPCTQVLLNDFSVFLFISKFTKTRFRTKSITAEAESSYIGSNLNGNWIKGH